LTEPGVRTGSYVSTSSLQTREPRVAKVLYTANALVTGGREKGHGRTADGELEVDLRTPKEMGGSGGGTNPEELFAVGYAACFESALGGVARHRKLRTLGFSGTCE
jgi:Ohr subfamily peroxiredoxin